MTSPITPELQSKIALWRMKTADGTITQEELKEAIKHLRQGRLAAASAAARSPKAKARVAAPSAESLLDELDGL